MCNASVKYPKYYCSPFKNENFFFLNKVKAKPDLKHFSRQNEYRTHLFYCRLVFLNKFYKTYIFYKKKSIYFEIHPVKSGYCIQRP